MARPLTCFPPSQTDHNLRNLARRSSASSVPTPANQQARSAAAANRRPTAARRQPISGAVSSSQPISALDTPTGAGGGQLRHRAAAARRAAPHSPQPATGARRGSASRDTPRPLPSVGRQPRLECRPAPLGDGAVRTYPIDEPCCAPPRLCREHARLAPAPAPAPSQRPPSATEESEVPTAPVGGGGRTSRGI